MENDCCDLCDCVELVDDAELRAQIENYKLIPLGYGGKGAVGTQGEGVGGEEPGVVGAGDGGERRGGDAPVGPGLVAEIELAELNLQVVVVVGDQVEKVLLERVLLHLVDGLPDLKLTEDGPVVVVPKNDGTIK